MELNVGESLSEAAKLCVREVHHKSQPLISYY